MTFAGPERVIDLGTVSAGGEGPAVRPRIDRRSLRRSAVAFVAVLCAVTLTGSAVPRPHGARLLWTMPYTGEAFVLTADSLYLQADGGRILRAYELADGSLRWTRRLAGPASIRFSPAGDVLLPVSGIAGNPPTRRTAALDPATGTERWAVTGEIAYTRGELAVVVDRDRRTGDLAGLSAVRLTDGGTLWTRAADAGLQWAADDDHLLTVGPDGQARVLRLTDRTEVATGRVDWLPGGGDAQLRGDMIYISRYQDRPSVTAYSVPAMRREWHIETDGGGLSDCGSALCSDAGRATVAHDRRTGAVRWRSTGWTGPWPIAPGRLAMSSASSSAEHAVVDEASGRVLARLGRGTLLLSPAVGGRSDPPVYFLHNTAERADRVAVSRLDPATGRLSVLGAVDQALRDRCQVSGTRVVCPRTNSTLAITDVG
jgi:putative pyrroloquinoline-quinone binding quinoprotein